LIDTDGSEASAAALEAALGTEEPQLAIREGRVLAARLERVGASQKENAQPPAPNTTTLITGATGTLGTLLARHLVQAHGARNLLLASRSGEEAPGARELVAELEELGASAELVACDIADRAQAEELIASVPAERPLKSVIHAAGVLDDGIIESLTPERLQTVLEPKARGAWNLHELTRELELSRFVLFSSVAATLGGPGQANYAAANAFLDALAYRRQAEGLPASAIAWGLWASESAMTGHLGEADLARMRRGGMTPISDAQGLELFDAAIASGEPLAVATPVDTAALRSQAGAGELPVLFRNLVRSPARRSAAGTSLAQRLAAAPEAERQALVLELVRSEAATVLGHAGPAAVEPGRAFKELGFDSLAAVELRNRLKRITGLRLPSTLVFDHPSAVAVAGFLLAQISADGVANAPAVDEFARLEALFESAPDGARMEMLTRLRSLVQRVSLDSDTEADGRDLRSASDDEVIALIEEEFGSA
jgi:short-subunit dehydrogenase